MSTIDLPAHPAATAVPATNTLLGAAAVAGPLWATVAMAQAVTRDDFDLTRHPLSLLSTGSLGWLQIANFVVTGLLTVAGAIGLRRALHRTPGGIWVPRLVLTYGLGMIAAGVLVMDPVDGFPAGTPAGPPATVSWHAIGHFIAGSIAFTALIAACYVLGHHFRRTGDRGRAVASRAAGTALLAGNVWAISGGPAGTLTVAAAAIATALWVSAVAANQRRNR